jgi:hypothetical protein
MALETVYGSYTRVSRSEVACGAASRLRVGDNVGVELG